MALENLITEEEAAGFTGVSLQTLARFAEAGYLTLEADRLHDVRTRAHNSQRYLDFRTSLHRNKLHRDKRYRDKRYRDKAKARLRGSMND